MKAIRNYTDALQVAQEIQDALNDELEKYGDKYYFETKERSEYVTMKVVNTSLNIATESQVEDITETIFTFQKMYGRANISFYIETIQVAGSNESYYAPCWRIDIEKSK